MARTFEFELRGDPAAKLQAIKTAAAEKGVVFRGNVKKGTFHIDIDLFLKKVRVLDGSYTINEGRIRITVKKIPPNYTWEKAEAELRGFVERD